ncbi:hypothetical protein DD237_008530 [Peronospora effusa]|uniref:Cupin-like domain-containing protein n=1 Tax=Peronospora effusa TaxID=542832 RepID=A0A3R7WL34_9STRA|nr:hypothetical protein DD237_008530 [Peronospora effusa]
MVQVSKMLLGLAAMLMSSIIPTNLAELVPAFEISTFDYDNLSTGNTPNEVLNALKQDGIISLANVPSYAHVRRSYLDSAAACAMSAHEAEADFLLHKTLTDGTKRYTISAPSGLAANAAATTTDAVCPGYQDIYNKFSSLLELVVISVATTLDATDFITKDGYGRPVSSRKMIMDAVRLDHFHVYETPSLHDRRLMSDFSGTQTDPSSENDFTLELHEDHGMFIAFSTPTFYKVSTDGTKRTFESVSAGSENYAESGLIIQTRDGRRVRPVLKPDEVTLMVGAGFEHWVDTSEKLPAVMHGMRMPKVETMATESLLRAWFGKMTLLPSYQRMVQHMDFDVHRNFTARYLQQGHQSNRQLLGCAPGRRLDDSMPPDEVTLMVGAGFEHWVDTSEKLPAVMHGMRMPKVETMATESLLRAWFGKMTLLPSYQRMVQHMDFDVHRNFTARYLQQGHQSNRQLLGCASGRHLAASADEKCSYRECYSKANTIEPPGGCQTFCNSIDGTDEGQCKAKCDCKPSQTGKMSWMTCVKGKI